MKNEIITTVKWPGIKTGRNVALLGCGWGWGGGGGCFLSRYGLVSPEISSKRTKTL